MAKIIIIGAGISGLSTYLFLRKHLVLCDSSTPSSQAEQQQYDIRIYEAYDIHQSHFNASLVNPALDDANLREESPTVALAASETDPIFTAQAIGAAIGIARNGLNVLARLDKTGDQQSGAHGVSSSSLIEEMAVYGHPIERWQLSTARGFTLGQVDLARPRAAAAATMKPSLSKPGQSPSPSSTLRNPCPYHGIMIARQSCWEILRDRVTRESPSVIMRRKVVDVIIGDERTRNVVKFDDGSQEEADLVIGADGIRSIVRRAMFRQHGIDHATTTTTTTTTTGGGGAAQTHHDGQPHSPTRKAPLPSSWLRSILSYLPSSLFPFGHPKAIQTDYVSPRYEGLVGVGGFVPSSVLQATGHKPGTMTIVFGPNGFFGYGYLTSSRPSPKDATAATKDTDTAPATAHVLPIPAPGPLAGWWSTCSSPNPFPYSTPAESPSPAPAPAPAPAPGSIPHTEPASTDRGKAAEFNKQLALAALLQRHRNWRNPAIQAILACVENDTNTNTEHQQQQQQQTQSSHRTDSKTNNENNSLLFLLPGKALDTAYPTWTTPELPHWTLRGRAVLVGDAAHALQPSSGQGASQALEDAEALAVFLSRSLAAAAGHGANTNSSSSNSTTDTAGTPSPSPSPALLHRALTQALRAYETLRMPRVHAIHVRAQRMSRMKADMGLLAEWAMYLAIYVGTWFGGGNGNGPGSDEDGERYYDALFGHDGLLRGGEAEE
ncbi:hypothetical protein AYL99_05116 [Fonsecaea erecta]|uniref:FAD-binding domain-containing protein n=1 Tax=Fonsecaea erecta TaxID=1367422 RepID=A0A178ZK01_9EURO|nr:hypothetical protein AYL99_05116 [Fonsecaea erecta]OAP60114.1 hypothetical protein AYL99_05116 [Fonsecaea erecta]